MKHIYPQTSDAIDSSVREMNHDGQLTLCAAVGGHWRDCVFFHSRMR